MTQRSGWEPVSERRARQREEDRRVALVVTALGGAVLLYLTLFSVLGALTERACVKAGYTAGRVTATWGRYCTAREGGSDVVLPLPEARRRPRR